MDNVVEQSQSLLFWKIVSEGVSTYSIGALLVSQSLLFWKIVSENDS